MIKQEFKRMIRNEEEGKRKTENDGENKMTGNDEKKARQEEKGRQKLGEPEEEIGKRGRGGNKDKCRR